MREGRETEQKGMTLYKTESEDSSGDMEGELLCINSDFLALDCNGMLFLCFQSQLILLSKSADVDALNMLKAPQ